MSHPFTPEYMQAGKTNASGEIGVMMKKVKGDQDSAQADENPMMFRNSARICESDSVTAGCQADQVEENPDVEMEMIREEMNITITDKERLSFFKILRMAMRRRIESFAQDVSIVFLSHLVKPSAYKVGSVIRKAVWTMLLLFGVGFMTFQIYDRASYYLTYQTIVDYRVAYNRSLRFPTVTILSESVISMKAIRSLGNKINHLLNALQYLNCLYYS